VTRKTVAAAVLGVLLLAGCGTQDKATDADWKAFDLTWSQAPQGDKDVLCWGIKARGEDWTAEHSPGLDRPRVFAAMLNARCTKEGY
jgi:hypothetical protein